MWTVGFWKGVFERVFWTFVQSIGGNLGMMAFSDFEANWKTVLGAAAIAAFLSFAKSNVINTINVGPAGSASMVFDRPADPENREVKPNLPRSME